MTEPTPTTRAKPVDPARLARLRALRKALDLTQEELADAAGLSRVQVNKIENGRDKASKHETIAALARGFGTTVDELDGTLAGDGLTVEMLAKRVKRRTATETAK